MEAYIFISADPGMHWEITEAALEMIEGVKMAHAVTGQFDVIAYAEFGNMDTLADIIEKFQSLKGVQRTWTAVAIPPQTWIAAARDQEFALTLLWAPVLQNKAMQSFIVEQ